VGTFTRSALSCAFAKSREAIATTSHHSLRRIAGMTFVNAIFAVLRIPQRILSVIVEAVSTTCGSGWVGYTDQNDLSNIAC
jgi:hypothetical protein